MSLDQILKFGNPLLSQQCEPVKHKDDQLQEEIALLFATLEAFQKEHGWGRAIAAPQIGITKRMIAVNLGRGPFIMINPEITRMSNEKYRLWDDCMSMPTMLIEVERACGIDVHCYDEHVNAKQFKNCASDVSELLQHEIDHLDGILMIDRRAKNGAIIHREEKSAYEEWRKTPSR